MDRAMVINGICMAAALAAATMITRFLPFVIFAQGKKMPGFMEHLGKTLPYAAMGLLVVYCLKDVNVSGNFHGLPEFLAVAAIAVVHWWKENTLLSIGAGTVLYMVLVQIVFV